MGPRLRQLNLTFVPVEDRLLLKVSTSENQEYRAWCTRRYAQMLLKRLETLFDTEVAEPSQVVPQAARKEVAELKHHGKLNEEAFSAPYEAEPVGFPLGEDGLLLTQLSCREESDGRVSMMLGSQAAGKGLTLSMDNKLRHHFYELLSRACERAEWFEQQDRVGNPVVH